MGTGRFFLNILGKYFTKMRDAKKEKKTSCLTRGFGISASKTSGSTTKRLMLFKLTVNEQLLN
jgi:hypothetical protein